ncbi:hypothetical protein KJ705_01705 [Patescibacteria group bacterium]|nr:hypothetical protein [Patescibacteria group bacterium]
MIYLIGGAPRSGKTLLAKSISKSLGIPWISADTIESVVVLHTAKKDIGKLFPKRVMRRKTKQSNDIMYAQYSVAQIVNAYIRQSKSIWKAIDMIINCEMCNGREYIIEGHQIHPAFVARLQKKYSKKSIASVFLTRSDIPQIIKSCTMHKQKNDWFVTKTLNKETYPKIARMISHYSNYFANEARKHKFKIINMDARFTARFSEAIRYLKKV